MKRELTLKVLVIVQDCLRAAYVIAKPALNAVPGIAYCYIRNNLRMRFVNRLSDTHSGIIFVVDLNRTDLGAVSAAVAFSLAYISWMANQV